MLSLIDDKINQYEYSIGGKLGQVLLQSQAGNISGDLTFSKNLRIQNLNSYSELQVRNSLLNVNCAFKTNSTVTAKFLLVCSSFKL
jgi:hypothetical protein